MRLKRAICISQALMLGMLNIPMNAAAEENKPELVDSGIDYTESTETINNPGAGYTSPLWYTCKPGDTPVKNPTGNLVLMLINIGAFSSGVNGTTDDEGNYTEGVDYDLDEAFFEGLRGTLENCRTNGCTVAIRFRYDELGKNNPEPATFDQVLNHISQIEENGVLEDYKDLIMYVESGFVGCWGEQHGGKYTSTEYKAQLLDAMLKAVPKEIPVTVRTANIFSKWAGIENSELADWVSEPGSDAARVCLYNDGYMGSDSDLGTFINREIETTWIGNQATTSYYGGEFSGNLEWAQKYDTYLPENAIPEMYKTHLSYINSNVYQLYKDYTFGEAYDVENVDNSAYYGETVFKFIRDHIGYRFVLRDSELSAEVGQGEVLTVDMSVENTGFANPIREQRAELILERDGNYIITDVDVDTRQWRSCATTDTYLEMKLPGGIDAGEWNVYMRLSVGNDGITDGYKRSVHFANNGTWNGSLGANYIGSFTVTENDDIGAVTDNTFYQMNAEGDASVSQGNVYTYNDIIMLDGIRSSGAEWTDSILAAEGGDNKLYITNDDKYLYVTAEIIQSAASPVYNLQIRNASENNKFYWMYYTTGGFVYFNNGSYDGCACKWSGNYVEFRIPFGSVMNLAPGVELSSVRVSIQDSANEWVNVGELTGENYTIKDTFDVHSVGRTVSMAEGDSLSLDAVCSLEDGSYQWYHNGEAIDGAVQSAYTIENAASDSEGVYSVKITSSSGTEREIEMCIVEKVYPISFRGDVNSDGEVNSTDAVLLRSYILRRAGIEDISAENSDINADGAINSFDEIFLRNILINK